MAARLEKLFTVRQENLRDTMEEIREALQRDFHFRKENASKQWPVLTRCDFRRAAVSTEPKGTSSQIMAYPVLKYCLDF